MALQISKNVLKEDKNSTEERMAEQNEATRIEDNKNYCIFEKRICKYADKKDNIFDCVAKSDEETTCRNKTSN